MSALARPLHFVFKIASRTKTIDFYTRVLGMKILRHEEFEEGCGAACNGPYDGKWSKTMIGYGEEDTNFVIELTYNYGIRNYKLGNEFNHIKISLDHAKFEAIKSLATTENVVDDGKSSTLELVDPNGYKFLLLNDNLPVSVSGVSLFVKDLSRSINYWRDMLKAQVKDQNDKWVDLMFNENKILNFTLNLTETSSESEAIDRGTAYGRIAFSCPTSELAEIQERIDANKLQVLTRLIKLDTPGKASVSVVILADPDGHEICFVGDEGYRELSRFDPQGQRLLDDAMAADKSDAWHEKKASKKK